MRLKTFFRVLAALAALLYGSGDQAHHIERAAVCGPEGEPLTDAFGSERNWFSLETIRIGPDGTSTIPALARFPDLIEL